VRLADRPKPRRNETRELTRPILVALNKLPHRVAKEHEPDPRQGRMF
jgi:hypothetical protein